MRNIIFYIMSAFVLLMFLGSCGSEEKHAGETDTKYTCPMHPQIVQDAPGTCPICGMDLVPMNQAGNSTELMLDSSQVQLANVRTVKVNAGIFGASKVLNGRLTSNPELGEVLSSKYPGRIEKLYVRETGERITAGTPIYSVYSEELQTLQQDLLLQLKQEASFPEEKIYRELKEGARNKLKLFGYTEREIRAVEKSKKTSPYITVEATRSGVIREINVTEGSYVSEGTTIMSLENLDQLWVEADVYPAEIGAVKLGTELKIQPSGFSDQVTRISFISPQVNPGTQLLTIRGVVDNRSGELQPGMQATVLLPAAQVSKAVRLPLDAVVRSGSGAHVWIKSGKETYSPRNVITGAEDADQIVITSGVKAGEEVVTSGAYLLYSEFVLKKGADPMAAHNNH